MTSAKSSYGIGTNWVLTMTQHQMIKNIAKKHTHSYRNKLTP